MRLENVTLATKWELAGGAKGGCRRPGERLLGPSRHPEAMVSALSRWYVQVPAAPLHRLENRGPETLRADQRPQRCVWHKAGGWSVTQGYFLFGALGALGPGDSSCTEGLGAGTTWPTVG
jgi:hypothetical protein